MFVLMGVSPITPAAADILVMCDRALGEVGRRSHLFSWLRPPGSGPEDWLSVDAYYPGNRLVVLWREKSAAHAQLYAELVPAHGLRLLELAPGDLPEDPVEAKTALGRRIAELELPPRPAPRADPEQRAPALDSPMARVAASLAQATTPSTFEHRPPGAARTAAMEHTTHSIAGRRSSEPAELKQAAAGLLLGVVLTTALILELYFGIARLALGGGHVLLAFGIAMDAAARTLGTVAAGRAGKPERAWACALAGSVAVAPYALFGRDGPVSTDPAPLAGLLSVLALSALALAVLGSALGI